MKYDQEKIEDYIFGRLSEEELDSFQFALMQDADLRARVEAMRSLKYIARAKNEKKKKGIIFFSPKRSLRVAAVFIGLTTLAVLIALYNNRQKEMPIVDDKKNNPVEQKENINEQQLVEEEEKENSQNNLPKEKEEIVNDPEKKEIHQEPLELKNTPEKKQEENIANEEDEIKVLESDSTSAEQYVETPPDSNQELQPIYEFEPVEYSDVHPYPSEAVQDSFSFELKSTMIAAPEMYMDIIGNDTIFTMYVPIWYFDTTYYVDAEKIDSFLAEKEAEEALAFPTKVNLSIGQAKPSSSLSHLLPENTDSLEAWAENTYLEKYIELNNQQDSLDVSITMNSNLFVRDNNGLLTFQYDCFAYGNFPETIKLRIFTNDEKTFHENRPLVEIDCSVDNPMSDSITGNFPLGLYYVFFEKMDGKIIGVEKFYVVEK